MAEATVVRCANCGTEVPAAGQLCSACGGRMTSDDLPARRRGRRALPLWGDLFD